VVTVRRPKYLVSQPELCARFRDRFRQKLAELTATHPQEPWPAIAPEVWEMHWGVYLQPFGDGCNAIKYLGTYVCRTAIGDSRMVAVDESHVSFRWKDRAHGNVRRVETVSGVEFVARYLRHVLPGGMRAIRRYGFCHPAAKVKRERVAFHTGRTLHIGPVPPPPPKPVRTCPCCGAPMKVILRILPAWRTRATESGTSGRAPPTHRQRAA
jgi:hypothetical protein